MTAITLPRPMPLMTQRAFNALLGVLAAVSLGCAGWTLWQQRPAPVPQFYTDAQWAHMQHTCGMRLAAGTGLADFGDVEPGMKRGWIVSMIPGLHQFRVVGGGSIEFGPQRIEVGPVPPRPEAADAYIASGGSVLVSLYDTTAQSVLEWKTPGATAWQKVDESFLYEGRHDEAQKMVDRAIKNNWVIPGMWVSPQEMMDPRRIVRPEDYESAKRIRRSKEAWAKLRAKPPQSEDDL